MSDPRQGGEQQRQPSDQDALTAVHRIPQQQQEPAGQTGHEVNSVHNHAITSAHMKYHISTLENSSCCGGYSIKISHFCINQKSMLYTYAMNTKTQ